MAGFESPTLMQENTVVTTIELVEGGNIIRQGHHLTIGYIAYDEVGEVVDLSGKDLTVSIWGRKGIAFEGDAVFAGGVLRFTLDQALPSGDYNVEFTATLSTDAGYRKKYPTNTNTGRISVKQSADDLGAVGISVFTIDKFEKKQKELQDAYHLSVDSKVETLESDFEQAVGAITVDSEVVLARGEATTLRARLDAEKQETAAQLAETAGELKTRTIKPLHIKTFDGSNEPYHPSVVYFSNKWNGFKFWMAYSPLPFHATKPDRFECPSIAVSNDGVTWVTPVGLTNPLQDLTAEQITRKDYFSDPSITMVGSVMEVWYRHTDGSDTSNTNVWRVTSTDGVNWTAPEMVVDSQSPNNLGIGGHLNTMRSQSVIYKDSKYTSFYCFSGGMFRLETTNPAGDSWTGLTKLNLSTGVYPWHAGLVYEAGVYHLLAYYAVNVRSGYIDYFTSTDGINFEFESTVISSQDKNFSNLTALYQAVPVKVDSEWWVYSSCETEYSLDALSTIKTKRGVMLLKGATPKTAIVFEPPVENTNKEFFGNDIVLSNGDGVNSYSGRLVLKENVYGQRELYIGAKNINGKPVASLYRKNPAGGADLATHLAGVYIGSGAPKHYSYVGEIYVDNLDRTGFYVCTAENKWVRYSEISTRINVPLKASISVLGGARVVINSEEVVESVASLVNGVDGQEIYLMNVVSRVVTVKHNASRTADSVYFRNKVDMLLEPFTGCKLIKVGNSWYQV